MKRILVLVSCCLLLASFTTKIGNVSEIVEALKTSNPAQVSKYFDNAIDIKLPGKDEVKNVGKNQASIILKSFYSEQNVKGFSLTSQRELGTTGYLTGKLNADNKSYNITVMIKTAAQNASIVTVRIN